MFVALNYYKVYTTIRFEGKRNAAKECNLIKTNRSRKYFSSDSKYKFKLTYFFI